MKYVGTYYMLSLGITDNGILSTRGTFSLLDYASLLGRLISFGFSLYFFAHQYVCAYAFNVICVRVAQALKKFLMWNAGYFTRSCEPY